MLIGADVPWLSVVLACLAYLPRSPPENAGAAAHHVRNARLWDNRLAQAQNVLYAHHTGSDGQINRSDDDWGDFWDEPADQ